MAGCEKHELNKNAYTGKWLIKNVEFIAGNPFYPQPDFMKGGILVIKPGDSLELINYNREIFTGTWQMWDTEESDNCNYNSDGTWECTSFNWITHMKLTVSNSTGVVKKSQFDDVKLTDENEFTCRYRPTIATEYRYTFTRQ